MAEVAKERIQPCLFDRLTDEDPESKLESRASRVMSGQRYREGVLRDLRWLLNTGTREGADVEEFGEVRKSVLAYGLGDFCGRLASSLDISALEHDLAQAIKIFEPRIIPNTLTVKAAGDAERFGPNSIAFEIRGELWASPFPENLYIKTHLDLDTGQCVL